MLHSTQTTKKHTGNLILRFGMAGLLAAGLFFSAPYSAAAETVPSAENTDAGEITIHFTHYDAQDLEFYLNTDQAALAFTDAALTFQDSTMDAPVTMSYLSDDGSYVLYQNQRTGRGSKRNVLRIDGYGTWLHTGYGSDFLLC